MNSPERLESDADAVREAIESPRFRQFMELLAVGWRRRLIEQGEREARGRPGRSWHRGADRIPRAATNAVELPLVPVPAEAEAVRHHGERKRGAHEPVITEAQWIAAQERIRSTQRQPRARDPRMLSGLARCFRCNGPLWTTNSGRKNLTAYYREPSRYRGAACPDAGKSFAAEDAERDVEELLLSFRDVSWLDEVEEMARRLPAPRDNHERERLQAERQRASVAWIRGDVTEAVFLAEAARIDEQLARLPVELASAVRLANLRLADAAEAWSGLTRAEKRAACRLLLQGVAIDMQGLVPYLEPWPEIRPVFALRRELVLAKYPRKDSGAVSHHRRLFAPWDLVRIAA